MIGQPPLPLPAALEVAHGEVVAVIGSDLSAIKPGSEDAQRLKAVLLNELEALDKLSTEQLLEQRYTRLRSYGTYEAA